MNEFVKLLISCITLFSQPRNKAYAYKAPATCTRHKGFIYYYYYYGSFYLSLKIIS